jgi:hypothetical protein
VIPAYNYAAFLPRAIDSACQQTHRPIEIVVVDDGSTDNTREIVAGYGEQVRYVHQTNAGLSAARNTGIRHAQHPFIALLDADDEWLPGRLQTGMEIFAQQPSDFGVVACLSHRIGGDSQPLAANPAVREITGEITAADILLMTRFSPSTAIVRAEVFKQCGGFDTTLRSSEDRDMWIRAATRWRVWLQPERLALIRKHGGNMSSHADRMTLNMGRVIRKCWRERVVPRGRLGYWLQVLAIYHYQTALIYHGLGRRGAALRDLSISLGCWPLPIPARRLNASVSLLRLRALARLCRSGS